MDLAEIERCLHLSAAHSVTIDVREQVELPGYVRTVTIHSDLAVTIEVLPFETYAAGNSEGGYPKYVARYRDLENLVESLERYLEVPMVKWTNFTHHSYASSLVTQANTAANLEHLEDLIRRRKIPLPNDVRYLNVALPWRHLERYGEFRRDMVEVEEDILWREGVEAGLYDPDE